jgi:Flp pilus assembly protein TadD
MRLPIFLGLSVLPALCQAGVSHESPPQILPLALTGPAYEIANQAYSAYNDKDYDLAIAKAQEALRQRSDVDRLRKLIQLAERDKDRRDHPERYPGNKRGFQNGDRSMRAYANGDYDRAADFARKAISEAPKNPDYRMMLIEALQRAQHLDEAELATNEAIGVLGESPQLSRRLDAIHEQKAVNIAAAGYASLARGDNDAAVSYARDVVRRYPQEIAYRRLLVSALIAQEQYAAARSAATEALALKGNDGTLLAQRGQMRMRLGDKSGAQQDFAQALAVGNLPLREQASLYAAMGQPGEALERMQQARDKGELKSGDEVQIAYFLSQAGNDRAALDEFKRVDRSKGLSPKETQDAAYTAMRAPDDVQAIAYFKRVLDYQQTGDLQMPDQQVFDTRRAVSDLSRVWGVTNTTTYRGASTTSGLSGAPSSSNDSVQNSTEVFWRPEGYRDARFVELYGRVTDTLWNKESGNDKGLDALQGAVGVRIKPFSEYNVMAAFERTFPLAGSNVDGDWLVRLGYGSSIGTDLRVDVPSWWTSQFYAEGGRYLQDKRNYFNSEWQLGRSIRLDRISPRLVIFPHVVAAVDYDSKMHSEVDAMGRNKTSGDSAGGAGVGIGVRYWFRETRHKAPQSYIDFSVQYREKVFGDDSAQGVFARMTFAW